MRKLIVPFFGTAALLLGSAAMAGDPPVALMGPSHHSQRASANAGGGVCGQVGELWRCRSFSVSEYREQSGHLRETRVSLDQTRQGENYYAYRHIDCPVPRQALRVMPDRAFVNATFDADSPECFGYGAIITWDPATGAPTEVPWRWEGMQTLEADLLAPAQQARRVTSYTYKDNQTGTSSRENCHGGEGWSMQGGGFTMYDIYRAFGPGDADGSFSYDTCGTTDK
jgi:hypothetical protein